MRLPPDAVVLLGLIFGVPLLALAALGAVLVRKAMGRTPSWPEKWPLRGAVAVLAAYVLAIAYAGLIEVDWVERTTTEIPVREPVLGRERFRIVHLSDLHAESFGRRERRVVELVREAKPDLVVITGDFGPAPEELVRSLDAPFGTFGVRGNDDRRLESSIPLLRDEARILERDGRRLCLAGQDYAQKTALRRILKGQPEAFTIFLQHMPDAVDQLSRLDPGQRVDLFLCGHTHGGQVRVPFWGAVLTKSKYHKKYERGLYDVDGVPMIVSRGVGTSDLPLRFLCRPEVAVIDLVSAASPLPGSR